MNDDYFALNGGNSVRLTQDASGDSYPYSPKDDTMTTDQPAWATDPRGLPPAVLDRSGRVWPISRWHQDRYLGESPASLELVHGPITPLWPDTQATSPLPDLSRWHKVPKDADIPAGTRYAFVKNAGGWGVGEALSDYLPGQRWNWDYYTEHPTPAPNAWATDRIGLWPDTPPTSIDPADIKSGMRVRRVWERDGATLTVEGIVSDADSERVYFNGYCHSYLADGCEWFLVADAPDDDAHWIRAIAEATPETAPTVYAAIKGEQA